MKRLLLPVSLLALSALAAADFTVAGSIVTNVDIHNALVAYRSADGSKQGAAGIGTIPAGSHPVTATLSGTLADYDDYRYTLIGTYGATDDGIVIGLNDADYGNALGQSFASVFGASPSEADLVSSVKSAYKVFTGTGTFLDLLNAGTTQTFLTAHQSMLEKGAAGGSLIRFSDGTATGSFGVAPVPEPASLAALGLGALTLVRRRRK